jgi:Uma2 family endonuclease
LLDDDIPILYEDEEEDMGESNPHAWANLILFGCLLPLLGKRRPDYQAFANLNCYYEGRRSKKTGRKPNFASDLMIARPFVKLPLDTPSYTIGEDGPAPTTAFEVLSKRTAEDRDLKKKLELYRKLKIQEYILVDLMGVYLKQKIQLKVLQPSGRWKNVKDSDGGLTSQLGFRLIIDETDPYGLFVVDAMTGIRCVRPHEAADESEARHLAEERAKAAEERLEALQAEMVRSRNSNRTSK